MFLILMLAHHTVKLFSLTSCRCPFRRGRGQNKTKIRSSILALRKMRPRLFRQRCRAGAEAASSTRGIASHAAHGQGETAGLPSSPKDGFGVKAAAPRPGNAAPYLETLSPAAARDSPASEPSSPRLRFPAGEWVSRELLSEGGGSLRRPHQHPSPALLQ